MSGALRRKQRVGQLDERRRDARRPYSSAGRRRSRSVPNRSLIAARGSTTHRGHRAGVRWTLGRQARRRAAPRRRADGCPHAGHERHRFTRSPDTGTGVWDSNWHFAVGTNDGNSVRLYVDGKQIGTGTALAGADRMRAARQQTICSSDPTHLWGLEFSSVRSTSPLSGGERLARLMWSSTISCSSACIACPHVWSGAMEFGPAPLLAPPRRYRAPYSHRLPRRCCPGQPPDACVAPLLSRHA